MGADSLVSLGTGAVNTVLDVATQLYMAKKRREEEERERSFKNMAMGEKRAADAMQTGYRGTQSVLDNMVGNFGSIFG